MTTYDVAVIGVGGMGSAACYHLAQAGKRVLGLDQFSIPNTRGSSHGSTRILRLGLHESVKYVPLVLRAAELWEELGQRSGQQVFHRIGSLDLSTPERPIFQRSLDSCRTCDIAHEVLTAAEVRSRFPAIHPLPEMQGVFQPGSGFVTPESAISAHVQLAISAGAEIHGHEAVQHWEKKAQTFTIQTNRGTYEAGQLLFTAGAWIGKLLATQQVPVAAERNILGWFAPRQNHHFFEAQRLPVWIIDSEETHHFYGFPQHGIPGFKLGRLRETPLPAVDPDELRREPDQDDEKEMRDFIRRIFPDADGPILSMETCFFENTPDRSPIIDSLPGMEGAWVIGGFSGHGFKYCSVMGEIACHLIEHGATPHNIEPFRLNRFA
jgi:sarcosine oxidase